MDKPSFARNFETVKLVELFQKLIENNDHEIVEYDTLNNLTGVDVRKTRCVDYARRIIFSEHHKVFERVGTGVRLATVQDDQQVGPKALAAVHGKIKKQLKRLGAVNYDVMSDEAKLHHNLAAATLNVQMQFSKTKSQKLIAEKCQSSIPQIGDTLKLFESK
jgi:hypothetical protein